MKWRQPSTQLRVAAAIMLAIAGCSADPRGVFQAVKEIEPAAKKRQKELRELSGVPEEKGTDSPAR